MKNSPLTFVQFTDIHLGDSLVFPRHVIQQIEQNFKIALAEISRIKPALDFLVITGDAVNTGLADVEKYCKHLKYLDMQVYSIPSSHDLALGPLPDGNIVLNEDGSFWESNIGSIRNVFTCKGIKFIFFEPFRKINEKKGINVFDADTAAWLAGELAKTKSGQPLIIGYHIPILPRQGTYIGWDKAEKFLSLLKKYNVLACICGHRHRNDEDIIDRIKQIQTGPLAGFQWTGLAPHYMFPVRAGYRIFQIHGGRLHSFYKEINVKNQVTLEKINNIHTLGPRPQVRPVILSSGAVLQVKTYSEDNEITQVEYSLDNKKWVRLEAKNSFLWTEWEEHIPYHRFHDKFNIITIRAITGDGIKVYDSVPVYVCKENLSMRTQSGPEMVFELITQPAEHVHNKCKTNSFPWVVIPN
ncbi:MAG: metallophosphoesterase [Victivallaceae bacterium]|nr:metallophosphoesterase [Victivallaceae bacterium]